VEVTRILAACRALRGDLPQLAVAGAEELDRRLAELLAAAESGERVEDDLLELARTHPRTRLYTEYFLEHGAPPSPERLRVRGYSPLPGEITPIPLRRFVCPRGDYDWYQRAAGEPVPQCPSHGIPLERAELTPEAGP